MPCAVQAVSQQLDNWLLWNSLCGKVKRRSVVLTRFLQIAGCAGFGSAGHTRRCHELAGWVGLAQALQGRYKCLYWTTK